MIQLDLFSPAARLTDPDTSHAAAKSVNNVQRLRDVVLATVREHGPISDEELIDRLHRAGVQGSPSGIRTRRSELTTAGLITNHSKDGVTLSGRRCRRWIVAEQLALVLVE